MRVKLHKKENGYAQVHKKMLHDTSISLKSKGLGALLESYSNDYAITEKALLSKSLGDKKTSLSTALAELEPYYLCRFKSRKNGGTFEVVWLFDSQGISEEYINKILQEYRVIEIYTLNYRHLLTTPRKSNNGSSNNGSSNHMYNNKYNKNIDNKYLSLERVDFQSFKKYLIEFCPNFKFSIPGKLGYSTEHKGFCLKNGYIFNLHTDKLLNHNESFEIWDYLYTIRLKVFEQAIIQNNQKNVS